MTLKAKDLMNKKPITARPDMTCEEIQELLVANRISGAPVIDDEERLVGIISMQDILATGLNLFYSASFLESDNLDRALETEGFHLKTVSEGFVSDFMTRDVITAFPDATAEELAYIMLNRKIHRIVIVSPDDNSVRGIVSTFDLLKSMSDNGSCSQSCRKELQQA